MRKALLAAAAAVALVLSAYLPAEADHVAEPQLPVTGLDLHLENYATNTPVDCTGATEWTFAKVRVAMYVSWADPQHTANPSEHFTAHYAPFYQHRSAKGVLSWQPFASDPSWDHQNAPAHAANGKFDASRLSDIVEVTMLRPGDTGLRRVDARIEGDESGAVFTDSCAFRVAA